MKISVAMIAHNEEKNISAALKSVEWADQIVVIDCESSDGTRAVAEDAGADIFIRPNNPNLNINKNISIDKSTGDWILILDTDEVITYDLAGCIRHAINDDSDISAYKFPRQNFVLGKWTKFGSQYPDYQLRLFKQGKARFPEDHIHEKLDVKGKIGTIDTPFEHHPYPDIASLIRKNLRDSDFEANYLFKNHTRIGDNELISRVLVNIPLRFCRRYFLKAGYRNGVQGLIREVFDAFNQILRWFRVWELSRKTDKTGKN
ncbi:MAG: glycosyltransferase family 2 protein [Calditrichaeota bacterium]|nr:glycosyltransferase family 2 protein [Calditrichota bacterium]